MIEETSRVDADGFQTMPTSSGRRRRNPESKNSNKNKNGSNPYRQRRSSNNHTGKRQPGSGNTKKKGFSSGPSLSSRGWSKPSNGGWEGDETQATDPNQTSQLQMPKGNGTSNPVETAEASFEKPKNEITVGSTAKTTGTRKPTLDDAIDAALAPHESMASLMASMGFQAASKPKTKAAAPIQDFASFAKNQTMEDLLGDFGQRDPDWKQKQFPNTANDDVEEDSPATPDASSSFAAFCQGQSTSELLADFGQADPHWKEKVVDVVQEEQIESNATTAKNKNQTSKSSSKSSSSSSSKLAPHGKAAIHLSIESFGIAHGAPSRGSRDRSGSPHTQPLEWLDVGDDLVEAVPDHLSFHDGLRSGVVKRLLKSAPLIQRDNTNEWLVDDDDEEASFDGQAIDDFSVYCQRHLAETKIFPSLLEAIHEGGHGYVSPLTMTFSIGSQLGRHRSVVATEWIAQYLRFLLRNHNEAIRAKKNGENSAPGNSKYQPKDFRPVTCSVSVGTVHRDVNKRIPQKHYKEDDEDYVDKKDRI